MIANDPRVAQTMEEEMKRRKEYEMAGINIDQEDMFDAAVKVANDLLENDEYARKNEIFAKAMDRFKETLLYNDEEDTFLNAQEIEDFKTALDKEFKTREVIHKRKGYKKRKLIENLENEIEALDALRDSEARKLVGNGKKDRLVYNEIERIDNLTDVLRKFRDETKKELPEDIDEDEYNMFLEERKRAVNNQRKFIDIDSDESLDQYFRAPYLEEQYTGYRQKQKQTRKIIRKKYEDDDDDMDFVQDEDEDKSIQGDNEEGFVEIEDKPEDEDEDEDMVEEEDNISGGSSSTKRKMNKRFPHKTEKGYKPDIFMANIGKATKIKHEMERVDLKRKAFPTKYASDKEGCIIWQISPWVVNKLNMWVRIISQNDNLTYDIKEQEIVYNNVLWNMPSMNLYKLLCHENTHIDLLNDSNLVITNDKLDKQVVVCIVYQVGKSKYALYDLDTVKTEFVEFNMKMYQDANKYIKKSKMTETNRVFELLSNPVDNDTRKLLLNIIKEAFIDTIVNSNDKIENHPDLMPNSVFYTNLENEFYQRSKTLSGYINLISTFLYFIGPISIQYPSFVNAIKDSSYTYTDLVDMSERNCIDGTFDDSRVPNEPAMLPEIFMTDDINNDIVMSVNQSLRSFSVSLQQYIASVIYSKLNPFYQFKFKTKPDPKDLNNNTYKSKNYLQQEVLTTPIQPNTTVPDDIDENEIKDLLNIIKNDLDYIQYVEDKQEDEPLPLPISILSDDDDDYDIPVRKRTKYLFNGTPAEVVGSTPSDKICTGCKNNINGKGYQTFIHDCETDTSKKAEFCSLKCMSNTINDM
jgi:hypothetical protein